MTERADLPASSGRYPPEYLELLEAEEREMASGGKRNAPALEVFDDTEIELLPPVAWLADQLIPKSAIAALYGAPGSGKSFLAIDLALSLAIGASWMTKPVPEVSTLYIAAEGRAGLGARVRAWKGQRGLAGRTLGVQFATRPVNLLQPADVAHVLKAANALQEKWMRPVGLIVVDTLAQCMIGGDENEAQDMSRVMAAAQMIRERLGATVFFQHHTRKDSDEERGSTALRGAVDTLMLVEETDEGRQLVCRKQKDAEAFASIPFRLVAGHGSCVVQASLSEGDAREQAETDALTPKRVTALRALRDGFTDRGATTTEWHKATGLPERTFYRVRKWAVDTKHVFESPRGGRYTLTPLGRGATTAKALPTRLPDPGAAAALASSGRAGVAGPLGNGNGRAGGRNSPNGANSLDRQDAEYADLLAEIDERVGQRDD